MKKLKILAVLFTLVTLTNVHAALQSRPGVDVKVSTNASTFFKLMRDMEAEGGALGLNATFAQNSSTKEYEETSATNNVDSHMCKNTEWGAAAMLSASSYGSGSGNVQKSFNSTTKIYNVTASTTGNMTGIFGMSGGLAKQECVAGGIISKMDSSYNRYLINAHSRYVDNYADSTSTSMNNASTRYIPGDATYETKTFSGSGGLFVHSSSPIFSRGYYGVLYSDSYGGYDNDSCGSRLVVWVGAGL